MSGFLEGKGGSDLLVEDMGERRELNGGVGGE